MVVPARARCSPATTIRRAIATGAILAIVAGCAGPVASTSVPSPASTILASSAPTPPGSVPGSAPPGSSSSAGSSASASAGPPSDSFNAKAVAISLERVVGGLQSPLAVVNAHDGSDRLFVVEQPGRIRIVRNGALVSAPLLDIHDRLTSGGEQGLLGLAFAPGFPVDPRLFVDYTNRSGDTVVSSFVVPAVTPDVADPTSERILLTIHQPYANHNGGSLAFGPDGDLYVGMGDGGSEDDPHHFGQDLDTLLAKILRIVPGAADGSGPGYTIPPDAPFAGRTNPRPEIRAYGVRNPWRLSFDRLTGDLWIGDVGQDAWEEVDRLPATAPANVAPNFGWSVMEGAHCYRPANCDRTGLTLPIVEYSHAQGCAVIGGYVARDAAEPLLYGGYLFGDYCSGRIWALDAAGPSPQVPTLLLDSGHTLSAFGEDEVGRLYVTDLASGELLRIIAAARS